MKKAIVVAVLVVVALATGYLLGQRSSMPGVRIYENRVEGKTYMTAYHADWPTYGLPLGELASIDVLIVGGNRDKARNVVNWALDRAIIDAHQRIQQPGLPDEEVEAIRKALMAARKHREGHPPPDLYEPFNKKRVDNILEQY